MYGHVIYDKGGTTEKWENWYWDNYILIWDICNLRGERFIQVSKSSNQKGKDKLINIKRHHYK